jgi:hypothetical protein
MGNKTNLLDQLDVHRFGPGVSTNELDLVGLRRSSDKLLQAELLDGIIDSLLCHCPAIFISSARNMLIELTMSSTFHQQ